MEDLQLVISNVFLNEELRDKLAQYSRSRVQFAEPKNLARFQTSIMASTIRSVYSEVMSVEATNNQVTTDDSRNRSRNDKFGFGNDH